MNNLFSTRFVRNFRSAESTAPFLILTDSEGKISFSEPIDTQKLQKLTEYVDKVKEGETIILEKQPFIEIPEEDFENHFNLVVKELGELASKTPEALDLLKEFAWKGVIAISLTELKVDFKLAPAFKAKFMINVKAKEHILNKFFEQTEFEKLRKERWEKPGFYFKINKQIIPTINA